MAASGGHPVGVAPGDDGAVWFTDPGTSTLARIDPGGEVLRYQVHSTPRSALPSETPTPTLGSITRGPGGDLWFTLPAAAALGRLTANGWVTTYPLPTSEGTEAGFPSFPLGIAAGPDGAMWFTEACADQVGRINPITGSR